MTYMPAHDRTADQCRAEIERFTRINAGLLEVVKDRTTRTSRRDAASEERYRNRDYTPRELPSRS